VLIRDGRIETMGEVESLAGDLEPGTDIVDLGGKTVLPGFIDTHVHVAETGLLRHGVDLGSAQTVSQVLEMLSGAFPDRSHEEFFRAHSLDPSQMREKRYPRREELDLISDRVPIFVLRRDGHSCVVNSAFLRICRLDGEIFGVELDPQTGGPSGVLRAQALERARECRNRFLGDEDRSQAVREACRQASARGVTTVHAICSRLGDVDLMGRLAAELPVDVVPYLSIRRVSAVQERGLRSIGGDLLADGSLSSHTAALMEPYADRPDERGVLYFQKQQLLDFVEKAHSAGLQVAVHAIGDRAVEQVLSVYEEVLDRQPCSDHRHRIEHAELLTRDQIRRIAQRGIALAVQPAFEAFWGGPGGMYASRLGPDRVRRTNPFRPLVDADVSIAGGSDSYITPIDPLAGIAAAVAHPNPDHRLTVEEAARIFTAGGAHLAFQEHDRGLLRAGLRADLVVLSDDPNTVVADKIAALGVEMVIKDGRVVFGRDRTAGAGGGAKKELH
jgi:predicted amidohydrolase YtcJ